jgi:formylglycine-generating enzyme required for sulfatase activity
MNFFMVIVLGLASVAEAQSAGPDVWRQPNSLKTWRQPLQELRTFDDARGDCKSISQPEVWSLPTRQDLDELRNAESDTPFSGVFKELIWTSETKDNLIFGYYGPTGDVIDYKPEDNILGAVLCIKKDPVVKNCKKASLDMVFCTIPAGTFLMGAPDGVGNKNEHPQHQVNITKDFEIMDTEVTQAQWFNVMKSLAKGEFSNYLDYDNPTYAMIGVTSKEIDQFVKSINKALSNEEYEYRLPTEAEWEYAAKGNYSDNDESVISKLSYLESKYSAEKLRPVRKNTENIFGLYGMIDSPAEIVSDEYQGVYDLWQTSNPQVRSETSEASKVVRGGYRLYRNDIFLTSRSSEETYERLIGFRLVRQKKDSLSIAGKNKDSSKLEFIWQHNGKEVITLERAEIRNGDKIAGYAPGGQRLQVFNEESPGWVGVEFGPAKGFISRKFVLDFDAQKNFKKTVVSVDSPLLGGGNQQIDTIPGGTYLLIIETIGDWFVVQYKGQRGYLSRVVSPGSSSDVDAAYVAFRQANPGRFVPRDMFEAEYTQSRAGQSFGNNSDPFAVPDVDYYTPKR